MLHQALTKIATTDQERRIQAAWNRELRRLICACNKAFLNVSHFERHHCSKTQFLANNTDQSDLGFNEELQDGQDVIRDVQSAMDKHSIQENGRLDSFYPSITYDDQIDSTSYQDEQDLALGTDEDLREWLGNMTASSHEKDA